MGSFALFDGEADGLEGCEGAEGGIGASDDEIEACLLGHRLQIDVQRREDAQPGAADIVPFQPPIHFVLDILDKMRGKRGRRQRIVI